MSFVRILALLTLILAVLPWGAYATPRGLPVGARAAETGVMTDTPAETTLWAAKPQPQLQPIPHRCRTAVLGSSCGPDVALPSAQLAPRPQTENRNGLPTDMRWRAGQTPRGILDPPRFG